MIKSSYQQYEIIVVDDGSTDESVDICREKGVNALQMPRRSGPAAARNYGAKKAQGDILLFVDSDVLVNRETISQVVANFMNNPHIVALFGSYDDSPGATGFLSKFRNLFHHFIHQNSHQEVKTFLTGYGAIYRKIFFQLQGFDKGWFSIEGIELGYRIWKNGYRIMLDKELQVKHLKQWGLRSWLKTGIFYRAVPWSRLILASGYLPRDLNLLTSHRISAVLVGLLFLIIPLSLMSVLVYSGNAVFCVFAILSLMLIITLIILNRKLYRFFLEKREG